MTDRGGAVAELWHETNPYIDGELRPAVAGAKFNDVNPATGQIIGVAANGTAVDAAICHAPARCISSPATQ